MANTKTLDNLRHSAAHLLAAAVRKLWPNAKNAIGPAIENGFYQDFDMGDVKLSEADFGKIEKEMHNIASEWREFKVQEVSADQAKKDFAWNPYKVELIEEFAAGGKKITENNPGNFLDLCKGGHVKNPKKELQYFKLLSVAGAYWRGSEKNPMLTRIYGTAWKTREELENHLHQLEEAKRRDHRKIGQDLELFTMHPDVGPGLILWLPKGTVIKEEIEKLGKEVEAQEGYVRVSTPHIAKEALYVTSGHLPYYKDDMYPPMQAEDGNYYLKPMNCPHMHMIYKAKHHTYKEFPIRYAEFGTVYRYEDSGTLMGMLRVRGMTQNDAHLYCLENQVLDEIASVMRIHQEYYKIFDLKDFYIELALPDFEVKKDKYFANPQAWEKSIQILRDAAKQLKLDVVENVGGAAFYGPKFDFNIKSVTGREFGASTNQLDFGSAERFKLEYTDQDGRGKIVPYIIHRAPLGSDERFIGFLIEHYAGSFPAWLSPVQVVVLPISDVNLEYCRQLTEKLKAVGLRTELDARNETLQAKIRDAQLAKVPYMLVVGNREEEAKTVAVRLRSGEDVGSIKPDEFTAHVRELIAQRTQLW